MSGVERTISARRVEVKAASSPSLSAQTTGAPRAVTLHERFSQLPKVEPKKEERRAPTVVDLNLFQEVGATSRRQATEQRQGSKREAAVAARRSIATTWTPSFDDNSSAPRVNVNGGGGRRGRQFEFDQPRETAFVIKGIPPPQPRQRSAMASQQQTRAPARSTRGGRSIESMPATRGNGTRQQGGNQRPVNARGGRGGPGGAVRGGRGGGGAPGNQRGQAAPTGATRGGRGGARGGRGGATRGGRTDAAKPKSKDALDAELDSYMLQTPETAKSYLDQQLEDYMHVREQESSSSSS